MLLVTDALITDLVRKVLDVSRFLLDESCMNSKVAVTALSTGLCLANMDQV